MSEMRKAWLVNDSHHGPSEVQQDSTWWSRVLRLFCPGLRGRCISLMPACVLACDIRSFFFYINVRAWNRNRSIKVSKDDFVPAVVLSWLQ